MDWTAIQNQLASIAAQVDPGPNQDGAGSWSYDGTPFPAVERPPRADDPRLEGVGDRLLELLIPAALAPTFRRSSSVELLRTGASHRIVRADPLERIGLVSVLVQLAPSLS